MKLNLGIIAIAGFVLLGAGCASNEPNSISNGVTGTQAPAPQSAVRLDLSGSGLSSVSLSVFSRTELEVLDLSNNSLTGALPSQIGQLKKLRVLDASGNRMTGVPAEIGQLSALQDLDLSENALTGLPMELGNLQNLRRLDLRGNNVSQQDLDQIRAKLTGTEILL